MKKFISQLIPRRMKPIMQRLYYLPSDAIDSLLGRRDKLIPPKGIVFVGSGDYRKVGEGFLRHFIELGGLKPNEKVLDVGCGIGRIAVPLTKYLNNEGGYEGFDIVAYGIKWCQKKITPKYPNFRFQLAEIYNEVYNRKAKYRASEYKFPYDDNSFDFVFLTSVFTHMLPQDMENYFSEIARVLKRNGRCLITFFLLNESSLPLIDAKKSTLDFKYDFKAYRSIDKTAPEAAVAYHEESVRDLYNKYGLNIVEPIRYGSWCERKQFLDYQDIIIAVKKQKT